MSSNSDQPAFLVDAYSDPAILSINGRASYLNCGPIGEFFRRMVADGRREVVVDFQNCTGMDSTFLGILAGAALEFRKMEPVGNLHLIRMNERNLELVRNLGLHRILDVESAGYKMNFSEGSLKPADQGAADSKVILRAHEALVEADKGNRQKFQDVLAFLKVQTGEEEGID